MFRIELTEEKLEQMLEAAAERGAIAALYKTRVRKTHVSQREAYRMCGGIASLNRWRKDGKIKPVKQGNRVLYPVSILEKLIQTNHLIFKKSQ